MEDEVDFYFDAEHIKPPKKKDEISVKDNSLNMAFKSLRKSAHITQSVAAEIVGLSRASVANIETHKQAISFEHFEKLCNHFGLKVKITLIKA